MREGGHHRVARRFRLHRQRPYQPDETTLKQWNAPAEVQPQIERHLLVARAARVEASSGVAQALGQQSLDEAVDVFVGTIDKGRVLAAALENGRESSFEVAGLVARQHAGVRQRTRPRNAPRDIVLEQASIELKRRPEGERLRIGRYVEAARP